ncbi:MAG: sensor histidine kinase [Roseburia sp.]
MRGLIYDLRPMSFDDIGFDITVERALDKFKRFNNINCTYKIEGKPYSIDNVVQITLLRVIQEACNNAIKHAEASNLQVCMKYLNNKLRLVIVDDGKGFDVNTIRSVSRDDNTGFGLSMMKERVYLLSGKLDIQSSPGNGCTICATIPILKEEK